jgi:hypothetical protein
MLGNFRARLIKWTGPSTYTTGGDALAVNGISTIEAAIPCGAAIDVATTGAIVLRYNEATGKVLAYWGEYAAGASGDLIEIANGTDLSGYSVRLLVLGK